MTVSVSGYGTAMTTKKQLTPREARERKKLSPADVAAAVPCALSTVYSTENAGRFPRQRALRTSYMRVLGVTESQVAG